jgi:hypothetical protein
MGVWVGTPRQTAMSLLDRHTHIHRHCKFISQVPSDEAESFGISEATIWISDGSRRIMHAAWENPIDQSTE